MQLPPAKKREFMESFADNKRQRCVDILCGSLGSQIIAVARRRADSDDDAREITQRVWEIVVDKLHTLRKPDRVEAWLQPIIKTACSRYFAEQKRNRRIRQRIQHEAADCIEPEEPRKWTNNAELHLGSPEVERVISPFPVEDQMIFRAKMTGLSSGNTAKLLGWTPDRVRKRLSRMLTRIAEERRR